jgi:hypothetical protein
MNQPGATAQLQADADELGEAEGGIIRKYAYLAMALLILAAIALIFLRFVIYLW